MRKRFDEFKLEVNLSHKIDNRRDEADGQGHNRKDGGGWWHVVYNNCGRGGQFGSSSSGEKKPSNIALPLDNNSEKSLEKSE